MRSVAKIVVLVLVLAVGTSSMQHVVDIAARNPRVLYLAAQYKLMTGDEKGALRLFNKAFITSDFLAAHAPLVTGAVACEVEHAPGI
jgi:hypothetical protein